METHNYPPNIQLAPHTAQNVAATYVVALVVFMLFFLCLLATLQPSSGTLIFRDGFLMVPGVQLSLCIWSRVGGFNELVRSNLLRWYSNAGLMCYGF